MCQWHAIDIVLCMDIEKQRTSTFSTQKGERIFFRNWVTTGKPKCIVVIVHGLNSHSAYYHDFALHLIENGHEVYAMDLPGRGRSDGERFYISDYKEIVAVIDQLIGIAESANPTVPIVLFGHSAGGVFAAVYTLFHQAKLYGLICESFAFQIHPVAEIGKDVLQFDLPFFPARRVGNFDVRVPSQETNELFARVARRSDHSNLHLFHYPNSL